MRWKLRKRSSRYWRCGGSLSFVYTLSPTLKKVMRTKACSGTKPRCNRLYFM
ncbi:hypothetical protein LINPERPRIM_LOCUS16557 [Linum perenne]